ncbi:peptidase U32 [Shewanella denitrificans OS217]|jgi:23S rRNA 5-hydroxycytidine C2501 synthase|uniref:Peptidase U32 n=1 Tax=Shewanella denitrificans (strain OS217 / ATCC BAA-1090 / DSM 15013) TaxID=318161 RepID=Q12RB0_SHEDO|nr:U32 family peptidase [Shewanella denitrificans]ABE54016.1 peptidase U32 [Shewanella denitrificans OS217]
MPSVEIFTPTKITQTPVDPKGTAAVSANRLASATNAATLPKRQLELLAPAKNADYGIEAIRHGADAVYIGGPAFGARHNAGNSVEDIKRLTAFAHSYHAQVFVALNTILMDSEIDKAQALIWDLYHAGVDALIIQDMGVLQLELPPIALHASTQMDNRTPEKAIFLEQVGFSQVVLARELNIPQIRDIAASTKMKLEFFIHGALCVSYSGLCNLSHAYSNRSANRGECSQMCRLPCNLTTRDGDVLAENQHLLSLKDNNQTDNLEALIDAGVSSFKIEGRLKDITYLKNVTAHYRQQLDAIIAKRDDLESISHGSCEFNFNPDPDKSFNRGKTDYFVNERTEAIEHFSSPKFIGEKVGRITKVGKDSVTVDTSESGKDIQFNNGDGLCFFVEQFEKQRLSDDKLSGLRVNRAEGNILHLTEVPKDLKVGVVLYRNFDHKFEATLNKESAKRKISVDMQLFDTDSGVGLSMSDMHGHSVTVTLACAKEAANDQAKAAENINKQLGKLGSSDFVLNKLNLKLTQMWFLPASALNELRRDAIEALMTVRLESYQRPERWQHDKSARFPQKALSFLSNVANEKAKSFYEQHGVIQIEDTYEKNKVLHDAPLMVTKHCLRYSFNLCPKEVEGIKADPMFLDVGKDKLKLVFDCQKCEMMIVGTNQQVKQVNQ